MAEESENFPAHLLAFVNMDVREKDGKLYLISMDDMSQVALLPGDRRAMTPGDARAFAERLKACWNYCHGMPLSRLQTRTTDFPVVYKLDENGEADGQIEFFCSVACRSLAYDNPDGTKLERVYAYGQSPVWCVLPATRCCRCRKPLEPETKP